MLFIGGLLTIRVWQSRRCVVSENQASHPIYLKVKGKWCYLYRAIDKQGNLVDSMLSTTRDMAAAQQFFRKAFSVAEQVPEQVTTDGHDSYPRAVREVLGTHVEHRDHA
ncbi:MAG TPA: DDE-type integrase/transposase/recombinase, partial [Candidatus Acidoferrum sp.]|nr:DDE-type integrase/transposase/recombinase [Candidatus Acidoferrum sp.]